MPSSTQRTSIFVGPVFEQPLRIIYKGASLILQGVFAIFQGVVTILKGILMILAGIFLNASLFFASHYIPFFYTVFGIVIILGSSFSAVRSQSRLNRLEPCLTQHNNGSSLTLHLLEDSL